MTAPAPVPRTPLAAHLALATAQVGFGLFPLFGKLVFAKPLGHAEPGIAPLGVAALRAGFGAASLALLARAVKARPVERRSDLGWLALDALFGIVLNQVFFLEGLGWSSATHAAVLAAATPAIAYGLSIALRREPARRAPVAGVFLAIAGAAWIALVRGAGGPAPADAVKGDLFLAGNVASYAVYLVLVKDVLRRVDPLRAIAWIFLFGAIANVPLGLRDLALVEWRSLAPKTWGSLAFVLLFPTTICYALNAFALVRSSSTVVAVYTTAQPIVGSVAAALVLGERFPLAPVACAAGLILGGVLLVAWKRASPVPKEPGEG